MKKSKKIISVLSIILCVFFLSFSVFATETSENTNLETSMSESESGELSSEQESMEQISESSGNTDESEEGEWSNETDPTTAESDDDPAEDETQPSSETEPIEEPEDYVSSNEIETIDVKGDVDTNTLTDNDWEQIGLELQLKEDSPNDTVDDFGDDFSFIKENDDKQNNGTWIIVLGIVLVACAVCSLLAVIVITGKIEFVKKLPIRQRNGAKSADDYDDNYFGNKNNLYKGKH